MNEGARAVGRWLGDRLSRLIRDREVILRTDGEVRYFTVSRRFQTIVLGCWVVATCWAGLASVGFFLQWDVIRGKQAGLAELVTLGPAASIGNAVFDATGWRPKHLPLRPDVVLAGLKEVSR